MYRIKDNIILRTPGFSFDSFFNSGSINAKTETLLFKEALYLASPSISNILFEKGDSSVSPLPSLIKYFSRACFRCTPFGLFAGVSFTKFGTETSIVFNGRKRCTRLDMDYLYKLSRHFANLSAFSKNIEFSPNNSSYPIANKLRYIEFSTRKSKRYYDVSEVSLSKELREILEYSENGSTISELVEYLSTINPKISLEEATEFTDSLIANHLLISELEPSLTGEDFLLQILKTLSREKNEAKRPILILRKIDDLIKQLDSKANNKVEEYKNILRVLNELEIEYDESKVFQVDLIKLTETNVLDNSIRKKLNEGVNVLSKLTSGYSNVRLKQFKIRFNERHENCEVPLLQLLDSDLGIGYPELIEGDITTLTNDIQLPKKQPASVQTNITSQWLFKKLQQTLFDNQYSLNLEEKDISGFKSHLDDMPESFSAFFRVVDFKNNLIYLESAGGSSATQVLSRFAYANDQIDETIRDIVSIEQKNNPNIIHAEIVHLPESRVGNIILHPPFYNYEIPYLAKSSLPSEYQIPLKDLYVSIERDRIKLVSKRLNKEIVPKLSSAHNFILSELPVYLFLCDLQNQNKIRSLTFNWGISSKEVVFLPRVTYKNIILHLATWNLNNEEWAILCKSSDASLNQCIQEFRKKWKLPRYIVLADGDNELFVDFENADTIVSFLDTIKAREKITLKEFLFDPETPIRDKEGNKYINQFVASFVKSEATTPETTRSLRRSTSNKKVTRTFIPGSEWVYYKYYCGVKTSDTILTSVIGPLTKKLLKDNLIDSWFFIRYKDSHSHLRVRFHLKDQNHIGKLIDIHNKFLDKFLKSKLIWKVQMDTYEREIERYGSNAIQHAEKVFFHDSVVIVALLNKLSSSDREETRWLCGMRAVDELMNNFQLDLSKKMDLMQRLRISFAKEFKLDKSANFQLDKKYRKYRADIEFILKENLSKISYGKILQRKSKDIASTVTDLISLNKKGALDVPVDVLLQSYIHMLLNRLIPHSQRFHEMIIYDFMHRHYNSQIARAKF